MFKTDQPKIQRYARQSPDNLCRVMQFVILTVKVPLHRVEQDTLTASQGGDDAMGVLYGWKHTAYNHASENCEKVYTYLEHVYESDLNDQDKAQAMIEYIADMPGFGLVKAGFVTQLAYGLGGCLDTHNLNRFGLSESAFKGFKELKTAKTRFKKAKLYIDAVYSLGGPQGLWDSWCQYVADNQPNNYRNAKHVSRIHCEALGL